MKKKFLFLSHTGHTVKDKCLCIPIVKRVCFDVTPYHIIKIMILYYYQQITSFYRWQSPSTIAPVVLAYKMVAQYCYKVINV